jgi:predicted TIM-barrel fold metal-dependent hydrolase
MWDRSWDRGRIAPTTEVILEAFGSDRCMLSSNYPPEGLVKPYAEIWRTYRSLFAALSRDEQEKLFARNVRRLYRIA